ncbi:MAG: tetratricopeptide repeat protein [Polyangiaceae bacterium]|nr:tetratricopeptide repeat protein [Polyangiaceae bacterium]
MKRVTFIGALIVLSLATLGAGCNRNAIDAVNLTNEADQEKSTNLDGAISKYDQAANLDPDNHRILWKLAQAYAKKEAWDKVASTCSRAKKIAPDFANFFFLHGYALSQLASKGSVAYNDAKVPLEESIRLDPNGPNYPAANNEWDAKNAGAAHFELAEVLLHLDKEADALKYYTQAIYVKPDTLNFYPVLAKLYLDLNHTAEAEQVLNQAIGFAKDGDKSLFNVHTLLGEVAGRRHDLTRAASEYELARKACGQCNEAGQQIAFFNLGAVYATQTPPKKSEAMSQLQSFHKMICKGAAAQRYADQCATAQQLATKLGGTLQP